MTDMDLVATNNEAATSSYPPILAALAEEADAAKVAEPVAADPEPTGPPKILGRDEILESDDLAHETVLVPEWGGAVIVRALTGSERDAYESGIFVSGTSVGREFNLQNIRAKLCARTIIGETGKRVFSDGDVVELGLKSAAALDRVFSVAQRLSRLTQADVKELEAQLGNAPSAASGSV